MPEVKLESEYSRWQTGSLHENMEWGLAGVKNNGSSIIVIELAEQAIAHAAIEKPHPVDVD